MQRLNRAMMERYESPDRRPATLNAVQFGTSEALLGVVDRLLDDAGEFKPEECGNPTEESVILKLLLEDLQAELDSSDPRLMKALTLKALAGYSAEEIAQRLQCSTSRVYQLIQTAKQLAKKFLEQD